MEKHAGTIRERFLLVLGGIVASFVLVELALSVSALFFAGKEERSIRGMRNVLCVGDSFTYGLGAPKGESYPVYLQRILDEKYGGRIFNVHNAGIPGQNSSQARDRLLTQLKIIRPETVIILIGHNNFWNFSGLHLEEVKPDLGIVLSRWLSRFRTFRLLKITFSGLSSRMSKDAVFDRTVDEYYYFQQARQREERLKIEVERYRDPASAPSGDVYACLRMANAYSGIRGREEYSRGFKLKAFTINAQEARRILDQQRALDDRISVVETEPKNDPGQLVPLFRLIKKNVKYVPGKAVYGSYFKRQKEILTDVLKNDLVFMVRAAHGQGASVIISSYPEEKEADPVIRAVSRELGVGFVDQDMFFRRMLKEKPYSDYFVLDGHCTALGYEKMAENIYAEIERMGHAEDS